MCSLGFPDIEDLHQAWRDEGLSVVGANRGFDPPEELADFRVRTGVTFPFVTDDLLTLVQLDFDHTPAPYPRDVLIGKDLTIRAIRSEFDPVEWNLLIAEALAE